jgi:hypothetical protein
MKMDTDMDMDMDTDINTDMDTDTRSCPRYLLKDLDIEYSQRLATLYQN